ncbi:hypothetical protein IX307_001394 [Bacteroides pyogenes]|uniref:hypothetical protein n=1 Tax=Bacteroides pyogenes TaxID=310300 RepID=UPI001BA73715|nr:hypothetical protein [Bacteroides pyogenes]MBR8720182.1 hypothetical protein [Bacteroides pyogenes]MBR8787073.1 hypothetical protein [Bacteroides pyogenes]MBR8792559.1 hypothetical protein [Bacteroides pyogenes]
MKYIVISKDPCTGEQSAFYTNWFDSEKFNPEYEMVVIDRTRHLVTFDGEMWQDIDEDSL